MSAEQATAVSARPLLLERLLDDEPERGDEDVAHNAAASKPRLRDEPMAVSRLSMSP
jgi:hypothetical protein